MENKTEPNPHLDNLDIPGESTLRGGLHKAMDEIGVPLQKEPGMFDDLRGEDKPRDTAAYGRPSNKRTVELSYREADDIERALRTAASELESLRKAAQLLAAKHEVFERMMSLFEADPRRRGDSFASEDIVWKLKHQADMLAAKAPKQEKHDAKV